MIIRLTYRQRDRTVEILEAQEMRLAAQWMLRESVSGGMHRVDVMMPAIGWLKVWDALFDHCYDNRGRPSKGVKTTDLNACKTIRRALNIREAHPAIRQVGAIGVVGEMVPAWRRPDGALSPYPADGEFVVLAPNITKRGPDVVTVWVESSTLPERPLFDEATHLALA